MDAQSLYYQYLDKSCPMCNRKNISLCVTHTYPERHFRCFCCWDCHRYVNYIYEKSNRREYNYYEACNTDSHRNYISKVLSIAFQNEDKPASLHLHKSLYFHPNSRTVGDDPMLM